MDGRLQAHSFRLNRGKSFIMDLFFQSLPVPHKVSLPSAELNADLCSCTHIETDHTLIQVRFHYHSFLLSIYTSVHQELEKQRFANDAEERRMQELSEKGEGGYPWSRREEMKALALSKGWQAVFAGGRNPNDHDLNTREFVLAGVARVS